MTRALLLAIALLAACADGAPIPPGDLLLRVDPDAREVEFGKAFPLTVVRVWRDDLVPENWDDGNLAPLAVELEEEARRESDGRIEETLRYRAYAFDREAVSVPAIRFAARERNGDRTLETAADGFEIRVRTGLDPRSPGPPELPGEPPPDPFPWVPVGAAGLLAIAAVVLLLRSRRRVPPDALPAPSRESDTSHEVALARLAELRDRACDGTADIQAFHEDVAATLRAYLAARFHCVAPQMTSEEVAAAVPVEGVAGVLGACDLVKFARDEPPEAARRPLVDTAAEFVRETAA